MSIAEIVIPLELATCVLAAVGVPGGEVDVMFMGGGGGRGRTAAGCGEVAGFW